MRDEDLKNLPQSIERWKFGELMQAIGFKPGWENQTKSVELTYAGLEIVVYATDENGRRYAIPEEIELQELGAEEPQTIRGAGREPAVHEISIPFAGSGAKPVVKVICEADGPTGLVCERTFGHKQLDNSPEHSAYVDGVLHKW